jgi:ABC-type lipoprotein export system ATPase subunit
VLDVCDVTHVYPGETAAVVALSSVSLTLHAGEIVALLGRSGSGKSTLLMAAGLLLVPQSGAVTVAGLATRELDDARRSRLRRDAIGFVFQSFNLLPQFSAVENVALASPRGIGPGLQQARELLVQFGLAERADHRPGELSAGEQQRVAIARALMNQPSLILADEPTGNLDEETGSDVLSLIRAAAQRGCAVLLVAHDRRVADIADRILVMDGGRLSERVTA